MKMSSGVRWHLNLARPLAALVACFPLLLMAQSAPPSLGGPSMVRVASNVVFQGSGLAPNSAISMAIALPNGSESHHGAVADANGRLSYSLSPSATGIHTLKVLDSGGRTLATAVFHVTQ